ncbi:acetylglucosamine-6-sulfatase [Labilibacter sediminis]|nr:acetylglucosamine-6-sulfatase [Labilibacter sediminis]
MKNSILISFLALLISGISTANMLASDKGNKKPNIIFLLADDLIYDGLGCMGKSEFKTPNIDRLANNGILFSKSYNTTAICMASRAQYMTGMYEFSTGCNFTHGNLSYESWKQSYPYILNHNGYITGFAGKFGFHVDSEDGSKGNVSTVKPAFDWWCGWMGQGSYVMQKNKDADAYLEKYADQPEHTTYALGKMGAEFIAENAGKSDPFCLSISFKAPHTPYAIDPRYSNIYDDTRFTKPGNYGEGDKLPNQARSGRPYSKGNGWMKDYQGAMTKYHTMVYGMDVAIGLMVKELKQQGIADNTIIIFTSDNGHFNGSKSLGGKLYAYEEGSRAPLIIYNPFLPKNKRIQNIDALAGNIDLAPTILDMAGLETPEQCHGKSLLPIIEGKKKENHESLMLINVWGTRSAQSLGVVTKDSKYIYWMYGAEGYKPEEELFNIKQDPLEQNDLSKSPENAKQLETMRQYYDQWLGIWNKNMVHKAGYPKYVELGNRNIPFDSHPWETVKEMYPDQDKVKNKTAKKNKKSKNHKKK